MRIKNKKGFIQLPLLIAIIVFSVVLGGIGYGAMEYRKTSKLIEEAQQLTKAEKYNEAIEKLGFAQNKWLVKNAGIKKSEIANAIEENKILLEDKSEYNQGIEEFNKGNLEKAKELLSKVSEKSPYYKEAKEKVEKVQAKITEKQIAEAVEKVKKEAEEKSKKERKAEEQIFQPPVVKEKPIPSNKKEEERIGFQVIINSLATVDKLINCWGESPYEWPDEGYKFILVNVTIINNDLEEKYVSFYPKMVVDRGYRYEESDKSGYVPKYGKVGGISGRLRPEEKITGTLLYEILKDTEPVKLIGAVEWFGEEVTIDISKYKIEKIEYEPPNVSIIDYKVGSDYWAYKKKVTVNYISPRLKNLSEIPAVIKSAEYSLAGFKGKASSSYVECIEPKDEGEINFSIKWEGFKEYESLEIDPGKYTITIKIFGLEGEELASKSFTHEFKAD